MKAREALRLLHGVHVLALQVLQDGERQVLPVVDLDDADPEKTEVLLDITPLPKKEGKAKPEEAAIG